MFVTLTYYQAVLFFAVLKMKPYVIEFILCCMRNIDLEILLNTTIIIPFLIINFKCDIRRAVGRAAKKIYSLANIYY